MPRNARVGHAKFEPAGGLPSHRVAIEAKALRRLIALKKFTVSEVIELVGIPPEVREKMLEILNPAIVLESIAFRDRVLGELKRFLRRGRR
jgi:hypothetical protein